MKKRRVGRGRYSPTPRCPTPKQCTRFPPPFQLFRPNGRSPGGVPRAQGGVQRGTAPLAGVCGCTARAQGESRGAQPHWQEVWRMCLHKQIFFLLLFPLPSRKGARGMVRPDPGGSLRVCRARRRGGPEGYRPNGRRSGGVPRAPKGGVQRGTAPTAGGLGDVPRASKGESRGAQPLWQEVWRMCLHIQIFFFILFPLPERKGARGMVRPDGRSLAGVRARRRGSRRGTAPTKPAPPQPRPAKPPPPPHPAASASRYRGPSDRSR